MASVAKITRIERQKKHKNRVSVFIDDEFAFGVDGDLVTQFDLQEGQSISQKVMDDVLFSEEKKQARNKAYRYLAGRAHSEKELREKLTRKGFSPKSMDAVIHDLKEQGLIDDRAFALSYARSRLVNRPCGERLLRQELWHKGVNEEVISAAIQEAYAEKSQIEVARELFEKRKQRDKDLEETKRKKRLWDFLTRRGFDWDIVKEVMAEYSD